jgi:hypothetical protein
MPDLFQDESLIGAKQSEVSPLNEKGQSEVLKRINGMVEAAREDFESYLEVKGDISLDWIEAFDRHYDRKRIADVIAGSDETDFGNDYVVICCEFGAALSHVLQALEPRLIWRLEWPYGDSCLLDTKTGTELAVFHWAIKKMSEYGVDDGFAAKINASLQLIRQETMTGES